MDGPAAQHPDGDAAALERRLAELRGARGRELWRGLEELVDSAEFRAEVERADPERARELLDPLQRRELLKLMGASLALAGVGACTKQPKELILPYTRSPEAVIPGVPLYFATAMPFPTGALGLLVESHMGRPTKVEGNPEHPASLGATDAFAQASVLSLYDPERSQAVSRAGRISTWGAFEDYLADELRAQRAREGAGLRVLTGTVTSPTLAAQLRALLARFPQARWVQHEPLHRDGARAGALLAFGQDVGVRLHLDKARVVLALDADLFGRGPSGVVAMRRFYAARQGRVESAWVNRLYVAETCPTITGAKSDHRVAAAPWEVAALAAAVAQGLGVPARGRDLAPEHAAWARAVAADLQRNRGACVVAAGDEQPPEVHALAHAMNQTLGNVGATVTYGEPLGLAPAEPRDLAALVEEMRAGAVELLVVLGSNPVYDAPADLRFAEALGAVRARVHLGLHHDETAALCHWQLPESHFLESWGDALAFDGTATIVQPLIHPLYESRSAVEVAALLAGAQERSGHALVRAFWASRELGAGVFEPAWRRALHEGVVPGTANAPRSVSASLRGGPIDTTAVGGPGEGLAYVFRPDPSVYDGRFANNAWLQELPKPLTKITWDNAALIAPATAARLGLEKGDVVELRVRGRSVVAPVWTLAGHAQDCVTLPLGYGRAEVGRVGAGVGFDAYRLRTSDALWGGTGLELVRTGRQHLFATTQHHPTMEGRDLVRTTTLAGLKHGPGAAVGDGGHAEEPHPIEATHSLYRQWRYDGHAWGMVIDLNACTGCNACVVACQAENNIPVVGKQQVIAQREMHWLRIDRYYEGTPDDPRTHFQPVPCMHCENAPCEVVCPVNATVHGPEGLNEMVYNRCVGTRYCSNNCPYKVRRFNFLSYMTAQPETLKMLRNPDVTVRSRGVMEKCTYCVQRIQEGRIQAQKEDRAMLPGEVLTACQQVCPSNAIVFGDINEPDAAVSALRHEPHHYGLLTHLNTVPRTTYLAEVINPNEELAPRRGAAGGGGEAGG